MVVLIGRSYLESLGYTVETFGGSIEALKAFVENPGGYDLVITDYTMPRMTGYDLACEVLRLRPGMPVIFMHRIQRNNFSRHGKKGGHSGISAQAPESTLFRGLSRNSRIPAFFAMPAEIVSLNPVVRHPASQAGGAALHMRDHSR